MTGVTEDINECVNGHTATILTAKSFDGLPAAWMIFFELCAVEDNVVYYNPYLRIQISLYSSQSLQCVANVA